MMSMDSPLINLVNVSFQRKGCTILSDVSWRIETGQNWALLGANGSGKTTLLKIITGYEWASRGSIYVLGNHFGECMLGELRKTIGWVSSIVNTQLPAKDSAVQVVLSGLEASMGLYRDFEKTEFAKAYQALEVIGGIGFAEQRFGTLSQGEQQRILIARALINQPQLIVLDEPCIGLDPAAREKFLQDIGKLTVKKNAPGIIYVTHHIEEIYPWIDHALILKNGRVLGFGPKDDVLCSEMLSNAFDCEFKVRHDRQRYTLSIKSYDD